MNILNYKIVKKFKKSGSFYSFDCSPKHLESYLVQISWIYPYSFFIREIYAGTFDEKFIKKLNKIKNEIIYCQYPPEELSHIEFKNSSGYTVEAINISDKINFCITKKEKNLIELFESFKWKVKKTDTVNIYNPLMDLVFLPVYHIIKIKKL